MNITDEAVGVNEDALRALAQAYDREDAAQRGEPDPWNLDDPGDIGDSDTWVSERLACARAAAEAFLSTLATEPAAPHELSGNTGELIDRMAEAIRGDTVCDDTPWKALSEDRKIGWRGDAERALAVVKEYLTPAISPAPEAQQEPVAYRIHAPEDDYYGTGADRLQFHPLAQHDLDNGYRQTPLFTRPSEQAVTEAMVEALRNIDAEAPAKEPRDDWTSTDLDEAFYEGKLRGFWEMAVYAREALTAALGAQTPPEGAVTDEMVAYFIKDKWGGYWQTVREGHPYTFREHLASQQEVERLREVLEPFALVAEHDIGEGESDDDIFWPISNARYSMAGRLRVGHLRRARAALEGQSNEA